jgi:hypothetical protein
MYDVERWAFTRSRTPTPHSPTPYWMDLRHVGFLYELMFLHPFRKVLEIGCFDGSSTSALVQAINEGCQAEIHLCDTEFRPCLCEVVAQAVRPLVLHERPSVEVLSPDFDLVIVDGDHGIATVGREVGLILTWQIPTVLAHDTTLSAELFPECDGSRFLGHVLRHHPMYHWLEDSAHRPGEFTDRGLLVATTDHGLFDAMYPTWRRLME